MDKDGIERVLEQTPLFRDIDLDIDKELEDLANTETGLKADTFIGLYRERGEYR